MRPRRRYGFALLVMFVAAAGAVPARAAAPAVGEPAPALLMKTFAGEPRELAALRGKVVLVHYWASWCVPCREEMPRLDALVRAQAGDLVVLALSADDRHDRRDAQRIASAFAFDAGMIDEAPRNGFGAPLGLPTTFVIDREGRLSAVLRANSGQSSAEALQKVLEPLLARQEE
jgi:thiol-disulfide isomerase/thioredoxin